MPTNEGLRIFREHTIDEIARRTGKSELYVVSMKLGHQPLSFPFRVECERAFGVSEDILFAPVGTEATVGSEE